MQLFQFNHFVEVWLGWFWVRNIQFNLLNVTFHDMRNTFLYKTRYTSLPRMTAWYVDRCKICWNINAFWIHFQDFIESLSECAAERKREQACSGGRMMMKMNSELVADALSWPQEFLTLTSNYMKLLRKALFQLSFWRNAAINFQDDELFCWYLHALWEGKDPYLSASGTKTQDNTTTKLKLCQEEK